VVVVVVAQSSAKETETLIINANSEKKHDCGVRNKVLVLIYYYGWTKKKLYQFLSAKSIFGIIFFDLWSDYIVSFWKLAEISFCDLFFTFFLCLTFFSYLFFALRNMEDRACFVFLFKESGDEKALLIDSVKGVVCLESTPLDDLTKALFSARLQTDWECEWYRHMWFYKNCDDNTIHTTNGFRSALDPTWDDAVAGNGDDVCTTLAKAHLRAGSVLEFVFGVAVHHNPRVSRIVLHKVLRESQLKQLHVFPDHPVPAYCSAAAVSLTGLEPWLADDVVSPPLTSSPLMMPSPLPLNTDTSSSSFAAHPIFPSFSRVITTETDGVELSIGNALENAFCSFRSTRFQICINTPYHLFAEYEHGMCELFVYTECILSYHSRMSALKSTVSTLSNIYVLAPSRNFVTAVEETEWAVHSTKDGQRYQWIRPSPEEAAQQLVVLHDSGRVDYRSIFKSAPPIDHSDDRVDDERCGFCFDAAFPNLVHVLSTRVGCIRLVGLLLHCYTSLVTNGVVPTPERPFCTIKGPFLSAFHMFTAANNEFGRILKSCSSSLVDSAAGVAEERPKKRPRVSVGGGGDVSAARCTQDKRGPRHCGKCGGPGHYARTCDSTAIMMTSAGL
jgi:hypothetical protein